MDGLDQMVVEICTNDFIQRFDGEKMVDTEEGLGGGFVCVYVYHLTFSVE